MFDVAKKELTRKLTRKLTRVDASPGDGRSSKELFLVHLCLLNLLGLNTSVLSM